MNRVFKLKYDKRHQKLVVVSEITLGQGKSAGVGTVGALASLISNMLFKPNRMALVIGLLAGSITLVHANSLPNLGTIFEGQGIIGGDSTNMQIHQYGSKLGINWDSFDIGAHNSVEFLQPDSNSIVLNRVQGITQSKIDGTLKANGQVFLLNPNGILFGQYAKINVAGMVASTGNLSNEDFIKVTDGKYTFTQTGEGQVINQGQLTVTPGGYIVLAGQHVSNQGTITTPSGTTALAAGEKVTLKLDNAGVTSVAVDGNVIKSLVQNGGLITADGGKVFLTARGQDMLYDTVINNSGVIEAKGVTQSGGVVRLDGGASGAVVQGGTISVDSNTHKGGTVSIEGQHINLAKGSKTQATGKNGGEVYVGGGWQGQDANLRNADAVVMDNGSMIDVSSNSQGNGGTAVLWSENYTNFQGDILAKGGQLGGNGGNVETSSHENLQAMGLVNASAPNGQGGEWLLDPSDIIITAGGKDIDVLKYGVMGHDKYLIEPSGGSNLSKVSNTLINELLDGGVNVFIKTSGSGKGAGNITVEGDLSKNSGGQASLTLTADRSITLVKGVSIKSTNDKLDVTLEGAKSSSGTVGFLGNEINLNGGNLTVRSANSSNALGVYISNSSIVVGGGAVEASAHYSKDDGALRVLKTTINGPLALNGHGWNEINGAYLSNVTLQNGAKVTGHSGTAAGAYLTGNLSMDSTSLVSGSSNTGAGASISGMVTGGSVNGTSSASSGVSLSNVVVNNTKIYGLTGNGEGAKLSGTVTLNSAFVEGGSGNGMGYGVVQTGNLIMDKGSTVYGRSNTNIGTVLNSVSGGTVYGNSQKSHGLLLKENATINETTLNGFSTSSGKGAILGNNVTMSRTSLLGTSVSGIGIDQTGNLILQNSSVVGCSTTNVGVVLNNDSTVRGGSIKGDSKSSNGLLVMQNSKLDGTTAKGVSNGSGIGTILSNNVTLSGASLSGTSVSGRGIDQTGQLTLLNDSSVVGNSTTNVGVFLNRGSQLLMGGKVNGNSENVDGVLVSDYTSFNGTSVKGVSNGLGAGVLVGDNVTLSDGAIISGTSINGIGLKQRGNLTMDSTSSVEGISTTNSAVTLTGSTTGGTVNGISESGTGVSVSNAKLTRTNVNGVSNTGYGVRLESVTLSDGTRVSGTSAINVGVKKVGNVTTDETSSVVDSSGSSKWTPFRLWTAD